MTFPVGFSSIDLMNDSFGTAAAVAAQRANKARREATITAQRRDMRRFKSLTPQAK